MAVGFVGGSLMYDLGGREKMLRLSRQVKMIESAHPEWAGLHVEIFRTFVPLSDLPRATTLMRYVRDVLGAEAARAQYGLTGDTDGSDAFDAYFDAFEECAKASVYFFEDWGKLKPVRVARVDIPAYLLDTMRPLDEVAGLPDGDEPFWVMASE